MFGIGNGNDPEKKAAETLAETEKITAAINARLALIKAKKAEISQAEDALGDATAGEALTGSGGAATDKGRTRVEGLRAELAREAETVTALRRHLLTLAANAPNQIEQLTDSLPNREAELREAVRREWDSTAPKWGVLAARVRAAEKIVGRLGLVIPDSPEPELAEIAPGHFAVTRLRTFLDRLSSDETLAPVLADEFPAPAEALESVQAAKREMVMDEAVRDARARSQQSAKARADYAARPCSTTR